MELFRRATSDDPREFLVESCKLIAAIEDAPSPVVAAVHGLHLAAHLELALACDLIVAAESTQSAQVEAKIGAGTLLTGGHRIAQRAGTARTSEITFGGQYFDAVTVEQWNIINRVIPAERATRRISCARGAAHYPDLKGNKYVSRAHWRL